MRVIMQRAAIIEQKLKAALSPAQLTVVDESASHAGHAGDVGGESHFFVDIVSDQFNDLPLVQRHRLIYQILGDLMANDIHALRIQAKSPDEI